MTYYLLLGQVMAAELRVTEPELKGPLKMKRLGQLWQGLSVSVLGLGLGFRVGV